MSRAIGIDLGTTNSCAAVLEGEEPHVITSAEGLRTTPSVVAFTRKGEQLVGEVAKRQAVTNANRTISSIKRKIGTDYRVEIDGHKYSPEEISAAILRKLKRDAESYLGDRVTEAVITVPAYFNDAQRQATKDAGRIAGLQVLRIINEPTAAAFAYCLDNGQPQKILVYDLGGGTFDVSIIEIGEGLVEVLATSGDNHLGGDDFDDRLTGYLANEFVQMEGVSVHSDAAAMRRIREEAERAKITLSSAMSATVNLPFLMNGPNGPHHMEYTITRAKFNELTRDLVDRTAGPVQNALKDAGITPRQLSKVLLVGGSTRIPAVQDKVRRMLGMEPSHNINPDECVAMGAAVQAGRLSTNSLTSSQARSMILMDVTPLSLSIETVGGIATRLISRNTTIPARHSQIFTTAANFQSMVEIKVYQGERQFVKDNTLLGNFRLTGIKRALAGVPQIEVTFDVDVNGILTVSARDLGTGKAQQITITSRSNLTEEEIHQAIMDAERYDDVDGVRKSYFDLHTESEAVIAAAERGIRQYGRSLSRQQRHQLKSSVSQLRRMTLRMKPAKMDTSEAGQLRAEKEKLQSLCEQVFSETVTQP